ncbi:MAG: nucleotidyltransferase family protein [Ignavibacteriales bacterium]|nr:nucleotidyltransferase family protein [Ignavibacteriales bacterium]
MKAMIFAAGLGTRLKPITDTIPKALVRIGEFTALKFDILKLQHHGFNELVINVHHHSPQIIDYLRTNNNFGAEINISDESERLLDTGGGLKHAEQFLTGSEPFLVYNCDIICDTNLKAMYDFHTAKNAFCTLAVRNRITSRYFLFDEAGTLHGWRNTKNGEEKIAGNYTGELQPLAFSGIHVISPEVFSLFPDEQKFSIVDFYVSQAGKRKIAAFEHSKDRWIDIGKPETLKEVQNLNLYNFF